MAPRFEKDHFRFNPPMITLTDVLVLGSLMGKFSAKV